MSYLDSDFEQAMRTTPAQLAEIEERIQRASKMWQAHLDRIGHEVTYRRGEV